MSDATPPHRVTPRVVSSPDSSSPDLRRLVHEHLIERSEGMPPASLAAFVAGFGSALELLRRGDAVLPWVSPERQRWIGELLDAIEAASRAALDDDDL